MNEELPFLRRPGLVAGLCVALGAWAGTTPAFAPGLGPAVAFGSALAAAALAFAAARRSLWLRTGALGVAFALAGFFAGKLEKTASPDATLELLVDADEPVRFVGRLAEPVTRRLAPPRWKSEALQPRLTLVVDVDAVRAGGSWAEADVRVVLGAEDFALEALVGDEIEASARLMRPREPANPGEADRRPALARAGVSYVGGLERGSLAVLRVNDSIARRAERFRNDFAAFVRRQVPDPDRAALVAALSVGERGGVSAALNEDFNTSGLAHVLSISGLHLAVAVLLLYQLLRRLFGVSAWISRRIAPRRLAALVALPLTGAYVVLIGAPPPALRAGIGSALFLGAIALGRSTEALNTIGWCLGVVALMDPRSLAEPSTQLSFAGVLGLIVLAPQLRALVPVAPPSPDASGWRRVSGKLREAVLQLELTTVAATLATAPLTAAYFERASLVAALANLVAWPASTLIVPAGAVGAVIFPFSEPLANPFISIASACAWALVTAARWFASWPAAAINVAPPTPATVFAYAIAVWTAVHVRRWRPAALLAGLALAASVYALGRVPGTPADGRLEITFLSVGQGDSTFVRFPGGTALLIDAGGDVARRYDPGAAIVAPFLRARGVTRLAAIAASHPHPDHIGGIPAVLARFPTAELWHNDEGTRDGPLADLLGIARETGARPVDFRQGLPATCEGLPPLDEAVAALAVGDPRCAGPVPSREIEGVRVEFLHPLNGPDRASFPELSENDNSLALRLTHGDVRVLLPGDLEHEGESLLLARGVDLASDLLKAPHHGSRTSSTEAFVRRVGPGHVVFCVGERNQFGFPARQIEDRYAGTGCRVWRTDRDGAITFRTDGRTLEASSFRSPSAGPAPSAATND